QREVRRAVTGSSGPGAPRARTGRRAGRAASRPCGRRVRGTAFIHRNGGHLTMRCTRTSASRGRGRRRTVLAAAGLVAALALTATACGGSEEDRASDKPDATTSQAADSDGGGVRVPSDIADRLKEHGIDVDKWKNGGWEDWDKDKWL